MTLTDATPFFTVVIPTRDRPELFLTALRSVLEQTCSDREIIAVVDGSSEENLRRYQTLHAEHPDIQFVYIEQRPNGHGHSYSMNVGVDASRGNYLCFLDDDDYWTDPGYLDNVRGNILASGKTVELHYSNQKAVFSDGAEKTGNVWTEDLISQVHTIPRNHGDSYFASAEFMLSSQGFTHLNCSVIGRDLYRAIKGMDESIRYEDDKDFYLRSIDAASVTLFSTRMMSLHNIPDHRRKNNLSTMASEIEKKLYQLRVYDKGICLAKKPAVTRFCCTAKAYELKHIASILAGQQQYASAAYYAKEALACRFNLRWLGYTMYLVARSFLPNQDTQGP